MPPKTKFTREEIIEKAVYIIINEGMESLTARRLAKAMRTSVKPIFTAFDSMDSVKRNAYNYAYEAYHHQFGSVEGNITFKTIGMGYINFAITKPQLFQLLFMKYLDIQISFDNFMQTLDHNYEDTLEIIKKEYNLSEEKAARFYKNMWLYAHGIASLCATNQCKFTILEINNMLDLAAAGFLSQI